VIVAYVLGGGLGHLTRLRAALWTLGRAGEHVVVATVSPRATDTRLVGGWDVVALAHPDETPERSRLSDALARLCADPAVTDLFVDAFPCGLVGELCGFDAPGSVQVTYLARLLRWGAYLERVCGPPPRIDRTWRVERLEPAHGRWLLRHAGTIGDLGLADPPAAADGGLEVDRDTTLVCHGGPPAEVETLTRAARLLGGRVVTVAPGNLDVYPVWPYFARAGRIVTAGGFNSMRQMAALRDRHVAVPFYRPLDDQRRRVAWAQEGA